MSLFLSRTLPFNDLESNPCSRGDLKLKSAIDSRDDMCNVASNGAFYLIPFGEAVFIFKLLILVAIRFFQN